jgi:hypothetical protein
MVCPRRVAQARRSESYGLVKTHCFLSAFTWFFSKNSMKFGRNSTTEKSGKFMGLRSWRRPPPSASVRHQSTSRPKAGLFQMLRDFSLQNLSKFILNNNKIIYVHNYLIFLIFLQGIEIKSIFIKY